MLGSPLAAQKSPLSDYTNVAGVKKLMATPTPYNSPVANYTEVRIQRKYWGRGGD